MQEYKCDVCDYTGAPHIVRKSEDGVVRCKICREKAKFGFVITHKQENLPQETKDWKRYVGSLEELDD